MKKQKPIKMAFKNHMSQFFGQPREVQTRPNSTPPFFQIMEEKEKRAHWDKHAKNWDALKNIDKFRTVIGTATVNLMKHGSFKNTDPVVSIASGTGVLETFLAKQVVPKGRVTCVDYSHEMNRFAKKNMQQTLATNMVVVTASGARMPLLSNSQNKVIEIMGEINHPQIANSIMLEAHRILKKEAESRFIITTSVQDATETINLLIKNKFEIKKSELYLTGNNGRTELILITAAPK